jgi:hypothetical protein
MINMGLQPNNQGLTQMRSPASVALARHSTASRICLRCSADVEVRAVKATSLNLYSERLQVEDGLDDRICGGVT